MQGDESIVVEVAADPIEIALLRYRGRDHEVFVLGEAGYRQVGLDAAARIEELGVDHLADRHRHVGDADVLQLGFRVAALNDGLAERRQVEQADGLAHRLVFLADMSEPVLPAIGVFVGRRDALRRIPVGALPAAGLAETGIVLRQAAVQRGLARRPRGLDLQMRPMHGIEQTEAFADAVVQIAAIDLEALEARDVDLGQIHGRLPFDDPFRHRAPDTGAAENALRVEAGGDEEVLQLRRFAENEAVVGREAFRAVHEMADARVLEQGNHFHGPGHWRPELIPILLQLAEFERCRQRVERQRLGLRLEGADQQLAGILLDVDGAVGVTQHRQVRRDGRIGLGRDVHVLGGVERHVDAGQAADIAGPDAGAIGNDLAGHGALVGHDPAYRAVCHLEAADAHAFDNANATCTRALGERHRRVDGIGLAVTRDEAAAENPAFVEQRIERLGLGGVDHARLDAEDLAEGDHARDLGQAPLRARHLQRAVGLEARGLPRLLLQRPVQHGAVAAELGHRMRGAQLGDQPGGMPGGAAGQLAALQQGDIAPAQLGQMIGDRAAGDAATDNDDAGLGGKSLGQGIVLLNRSVA